jgi:hypothetical protein
VELDLQNVGIKRGKEGSLDRIQWKNIIEEVEA